MSVPSNNPTLAWSIMKPSQRKAKIKLPKPSAKLSDNFIRFVAISDTHERHLKMNIPAGDVLLHCGDFTFFGATRKPVISVDKFLGTLPFKRKIMIAGNHDWEIFNSYKTDPYKFQNCEYLQDSGTTVYGYNIYGSPWVPWFHYGAFMLERGRALQEKWQKIPSDTDILLTHGPSLGYGDKALTKHRAGDVDLLLEIQNRIKPMMHIFGHIHESRGCWTDGTTKFLNVSTCDINYRPVHEPVVFDLPVLENHPKYTQITEI